MLEFMVLGEIPGTQIQYNFNDVLLASAWILVLFEAVIIGRRFSRNRRYSSQKALNIKKQAVKSKSAAKKTNRKNHKTTVKMVPKIAL